jgi:anaerobic selenocysteine-containing dehydrogenase
MIELAPEPLIDDVERLRISLSEQRLPTNGNRTLVLVGRRDLRSNNSWMHNVDVLVKGKDRCTVHVHPDDAARNGIADGAPVVVASGSGQIELAAEVTDAIMPGVVSIPHGWGHDSDGAQLRVASRRPGVNSNVLAGTERFDPLSGNAVLNGIPVTLTPA